MIDCVVFFIEVVQVLRHHIKTCFCSGSARSAGLGSDSGERPPMP